MRKALHPRRSVRWLAIVAMAVAVILAFWHGRKDTAHTPANAVPQVPVRPTAPSVPEVDESAAEVLIAFFAEPREERPAFVERHAGTKHEALLRETLASTTAEPFPPTGTLSRFVPPQLDAADLDRCAEQLKQLLLGNDEERAWAVQALKRVAVDGAIKNVLVKHPELAALSGDGFDVLSSLSNRLQRDEPEQLASVAERIPEEMLSTPAMRAHLTVQLQTVPKDITPLLEFYPTEQDRFWAFNAWISSASRQKKPKSELDIEAALRELNSPEYQKKAQELLEATGYLNRP